jgi:hypothetical protein
VLFGTWLWVPSDIEEHVQLIIVGRTLEYLLPYNELKKDGSRRKNIYSFIIRQSQDDFQSSIPSGDHIVCVLGLSLVLCKSKVNQLHLMSQRVDHDVLWLYVSVHYPFAVEVLNP